MTENSTVNPTGIWAPVSPVSAVFTLAGGISGGATSTNENKYNVFYPISALYKPNYFPLNSQDRPCRNPFGNREESPLVDIDLQILPLLQSRIQVAQLHLADEPQKTEIVAGEKNVLTQTVSIKESVSGDTDLEIYYRLCEPVRKTLECGTRSNPSDRLYVRSFGTRGAQPDAIGRAVPS